MIAVDTNILVAAYREEYDLHAQAAEAIVGLINGSISWAIPWPCVHEFIAVATNPRIFNTPAKLEDAFNFIEICGQSRSIIFLSELSDHLKVLKEVSLRGNVKAGMIHDARIAAICLANRVSEIWSFDRDFSRFPVLKCINPLI